MDKADNRFAHVTSDPRFKPVKEEECYIEENDERWPLLIQSASLKKNVDPRGREFNIRNLRAVKVDFPSKRRRSDAEESLQSKKIRSTETDDSDLDDEAAEDDSEDNSNSDSEESLQNKKSKSTETDDSDLDDEAVEDESKEQGDSDSDEDEGYNNNAVEQYVDAEENTDLLEKMNDDIKVKGKKKKAVMTDLEKRRLKKVMNPTVDIVRGVNDYSDSEPSSVEDSSSSEEEEEEYEWGQLDNDAEQGNDGNEFEETTRLAVCNLEWDQFKAQDIFMVLNSFSPEGGRVCKVSVFLSEFGKERLADDQKMGPKEVRELPTIQADEDEDDKNYEAMRKFYFNRLKYYYAVAEFDSIDTARYIISNVDGTSFRNGGLIDLRYIPNDMDFNETPESSCSSAPATYSVDNTDKFISSNYSKTKFDWDDDVDLRKKNLIKFADAEVAKDDQALNDLLAFDSEDDSVSSDAEEEQEGGLQFSSEFERVRGKTKEQRVELYRDLLSNLQSYDPAKEAERKLLGETSGDEDPDTHMTMEVELDSEEEEEEKAKKLTENLTSFEKYLKKRDDKQKEKKKTKKEAIHGKKVVIEKEDDDIPDDLKNDPFFKEELALRRKERLKLMKDHRDAKDAAMAEEERAKDEREREMALLMLDDDSETTSRGVDMREIVKDAEAGGKKRISRWKLSKLRVKEKRLAKQGVVINRSDDTNGASTSDAPILAEAAAADSRFSGMLQDSRANVDPSHPEFSKHDTPFMEALMEKVQDGARKRAVNKRNSKKK